MSFVDYALWVYAYIALDGILTVLLTFSIIGTIALIILWIFSFAVQSEDNDRHDDDVKEKYSDIRKVFLTYVKRLTLPVVIVAAILSALYPEKEDLVYIIGGATVLSSGQYMANSEEAKDLPDNVLKAANKFLADFAQDDVKVTEGDK